MFTWKPIYMELAKKLLEYSNRRHDLIKILSDATDEGLHVIKLKDQNPEDNIIPLTDIDPFTFFASFNRGVKDEERKKILQFMKNRFDLKSPLPDDFNGIPVVSALSSWYFAYAYERGEKDIDILWAMADAAITQNIKVINATLFANCLNVKRSSIINISMGLFWFNPDVYFALDKKNKNILNLAKIDSNINDWNSYIKLLEKVQSEFRSDYASISHEAHLIFTRQLKWEDSKLNIKKKSDGDRKMTNEHSLNTILYGPPGTGKTYSSFKRAVQIIDGSLPSENFKDVKARFDELVEKRQIGFITFHQSYSYEDFVEGFRPVIECGDVKSGPLYECRDGIFKKMCELAKPVSIISGTGTDVDLEKVQVWKMSLGNTLNPEDENIFPDCISGGFIAHGAGRALDFGKCDSKEDIQKALADLDWKDYSSTLSHQVTQIHLLKNKMQIGDLVIISDGNQKFRAIGKVSGEYTFDSKFVYEQKRPVVWLKVFEESQPAGRILKDKSFSQLTLYSLSYKDLRLDVLRDLLGKDKAGDTKNYVLIIDEINRGNISKILGEMITLLEEDKRLGAECELKVSLPYSQEDFGVPSNLYIIGTMNTADKSIALVDVALRRRFSFEELMPKFSICSKLTPEIINVLEEINKRIVLRKDRDHQIGHSYFMNVIDNVSFNSVFEKNIMPLLQEYFWNDWDGLRFVLGEDTNGNGKFIQRITKDHMPSARNKWRWFSDAGGESFDYLIQLQKNYSSESITE